MREGHIVIKGRVGLMERNAEIGNWEWASNVYQSLRKWKREEFDKKVQAAMQIELVKIKLSTDATQLMKFLSSDTDKEVQKQDTDQVKTLISKTHIKTMDGIRKQFTTAQKEIDQRKKEKETMDK